MRLIVLGIGLLATACTPAGDGLKERRLLAMGTWVDVTIEVADPARGDAVMARIEALLRELERDYYPWADGELARLNQAISESRPLKVSTELAKLLGKAREVAERSDGCFDPAVGDLVELWGFNTDPQPSREPPDPELIDAWLRNEVSIRDLRIEANEVSSVSPSVTLDLGGIAKGAAVDRVLEIIAAEGIDNALVNAGGDLRVAGRHIDRPWRIGIQAPREQALLGVVELVDGESAFTSGDYERFYERDGRRLHHILDPTTGYPVTHTQAVTVIATNGALADAAATALFVAGPDRWREVAAALGVSVALRVDASGTVETTATMRERLQTNAESRSDIIAAPPSRAE